MSITKQAIKILECYPEFLNQPKNLYEYLICLADYVVTYGTMERI